MKKNFSATAKRTLIASAVASLMAGSAFAADTAATPVEGWVEQPKDLAVVDITNKSYVLVDDAKGLTGDFAYSTKGEVKTDAVHFASKKAETQVFSGRAWLDNSTGTGKKGVKGLATLAKDAVLVNEGSIFVKGSDANFYMNQAMLADQGGTVENRGLIVTDKAYGMAIGSNGNGNTSDANKLVNAGNGRIIVNGGAAMELGSGVGASSAENAGSIDVNYLGKNVNIDSVGILFGMSGDAVGTFTNTGSIVADEDAYAIKVDGGNADINLEAGTVRGDIQIGGKEGSTVGNVNLTINNAALVEGDLTANDGILKIQSADGAATLNGTLTVDGATVTTAYGTVLTIDAPAVARVAAPDVDLKKGIFTVVEGSELNADTVNVTAGTDGYRLKVSGEADIDTLNVTASTKTAIQTLKDGELNIGTVTVTGSGMAIDMSGSSVVTVNKAIESTVDAKAVAVWDDSTLNLADGIDLEKAGSAAIQLKGGTLSTNSAVYRKDGKIAANAKITSDVGSTVSFTDEAMTFEDLVALKTVTGADLETLASEITLDGKVLEKMKLADWAKVGGATLAPVTAVVEGNGEIGITEHFGAKNIELTGEDSKKGTDDQISIKNRAEVTLVGGAQGTELVTSSHETKPIKLEKFFVTGESTLNLGAANGTSFTYGTLSDGRLEVDGNSKVNVRNGDFTLAEGLSVNDGASTVTVAEGATLRLADVLTEKGELDKASLVNAGETTVNGTLYAGTIAQDGTFNVNGALYATTITAGETAKTTNKGLVVLSGVKQTAEGATGWDVGTGNMTIGAKTLVDADPENAHQVEQEGGVLVVGNGAQAAAAYHAENHLDSLIWVGQQTNFVDSVSFVGKAQGTVDGKLENGDHVIAIDVNGLASSGYAAGADLDKTAKVITSKTAIAADKLVIANLQSINKGMLVFNEATENFELKVGDVTATEIDFGTMFYTGDVNAETDTVAFETNDRAVDAWVGGLAVEGEVYDSLDNFNFGRNELVDAIVFGTDDYRASLEAAFKKLAEANGWEEKDADYQDRYNAFMDAGHARYEDGIESVSYMAVLGGAFSTAVDINNEVWKSLDRRMSAANLNAPRNAYGVTPWVDVIGTTNEAKDLFGGAGYEADIYGAVLGADWTAPCGAILGLAFSVGQADANSADWGNKVENDVDFWGVSLYGSHRIGNFNGKVDFGYISTSNDLSTHTVLGKFDESLDADIYTFGLGAEYIVEAGAFNVVPHAGIRWSRIDMDDSKFGADYDAMNLFQMPLGVTFSGTIEMTGWKVAPMVDLSVVPAFGDKDAVASYMGGYTDSTRVVDTNPIQMTLGVNAQVDAWTFGVNYGLTAGGDERLNNSFNLNARYAF